METEWVGCSESGNCVQAAEWRSASVSTTTCLEAGETPAGVIVLRESERPGEIITTTREKFAAFIKGVKDGVFDDLVS